jgi:hypothetical protein
MISQLLLKYDQNDIKITTKIWGILHLLVVATKFNVGCLINVVISAINC